MKKYEEFLNEVLLHPNIKELKDGDTIISYRKYIYRIGNSVDLQNIIKDLDLKDNVDIEDVDKYEILDYILDSIPEALIFTDYNEKEQEINYHLTDMYYSVDPYISKHFIETLKTLKKYKISWINIFEESLYLGDGYERKPFHIDSLIDNFTKDIKIKKIPKYIYHGTSANYLNKILKTGLRYGNSSNFTFVYDKNKYLFFTSYKNEAIFYAENTAEKQNSFPIILKIDTDCIDVNKVDKDYDFYYDFIRKGNEYFDNIIRNYGNGGSDLRLQHLHDKYIGATYRKFSYNGNILPYYIDTIYYKTDPESNFDYYYDQEDFKTFLEIVDTAEDFGNDYSNYLLDEDILDSYTEDDEDDENNE
jgi:hypothetical protein